MNYLIIINESQYNDFQKVDGQNKIHGFVNGASSISISMEDDENGNGL